MNYAELYEITRRYGLGEVRHTYAMKTANAALAALVASIERNPGAETTDEERHTSTLCARIHALHTAAKHPHLRQSLIIPDMPPPPTTQG